MRVEVCSAVNLEEHEWVEASGGCKHGNMIIFGQDAGYVRLSEQAGNCWKILQSSCYAARSAEQRWCPRCFCLEEMMMNSTCVVRNVGASSGLGPTTLSSVETGSRALSGLDRHLWVDELERWEEARPGPDLTNDCVAACEENPAAKSKTLWKTPNHPFHRLSHCCSSCQSLLTSEVDPCRLLICGWTHFVFILSFPLEVP